MKFQSCKIGCLSSSIALKFDNSAAEKPVKFQSEWTY